MGYWKEGDKLNNGKYLVEQLLGSGGFGVTYRIRHTKTNHLYALKTLNEIARGKPDFQQLQSKFINEAIALASCSHENIVKVYPQGFQEGELWCMVMEYVEGLDLARHLDRNGKFAEAKAVKIINQVGSALSFVHNKGLLHRDIKPANILLRSSDETPVLIDFGLAREYNANPDSIRSMTNSMTESFAPIEQYQRHGKFGAWTDVYALAATLYVLVTKELPFPAKFREHALLIPPQKHNPQVSDRINEAILKGLELQPGDRPQTVKAWLELLQSNKEANIKSISPCNKEWFGMKIIGFPDEDHFSSSPNWNGLIFLSDYGKLFSFPARSNNDFEVHVVEGVDCRVLNKKIAIAIRNKKYEESNILAVIGQDHELVLFDDFLSLSEACQSSEMKMVIWFGEKLSFKDRLAALNQLNLSNNLLEMVLKQPQVAPTYIPAQPTVEARNKPEQRENQVDSSSRRGQGSAIGQEKNGKSQTVSRRNWLKYSGLAIASMVLALVGKEVIDNSSQSSDEPKDSPIQAEITENKPETQSTANDLELKEYEFDVITVNDKGEEINREQGQAKYFTEDLGNEITLEMVEIPGGTFIMGSPEEEKDRNDDESPQHEVTVPSFYIAKYEVTQAQWKAVAALPQEERELKTDPSNWKGEDLPVESVSWYDAVEFCARLSKATGKEYRLPSESEWEYACRAGTTTPFHFGETITTELVNYNGKDTYADTYASEPKGEYREKTTEVGSFPPSAFGIYDMHGNVWEWCQDNINRSYEDVPSDGSALIDESIIKAKRGGSWHDAPSFSRSAYRGWQVISDTYGFIGFRCVAGRIL